MNNLKQELAGVIDHTLLRPDATASDVRALCEEAIHHHFFSVCVHGGWASLASAVLEGSNIQVCAVVGFPHGCMDSDVKRYETEAAVDNGASEIDVVLPVGRLKQGDLEFIHRELRDIVEAAEDRIVKVILETCLLTDEEKRTACQVASDTGTHFVKTSTGFGRAGATIHDVQLMRQIVGKKMGVKASGGIRDTRTALQFIQAGANRLGLSAGIQILNGLDEPDIQSWLQELAQCRSLSQTHLTGGE